MVERMLLLRFFKFLLLFSITCAFIFFLHSCVDVEDPDAATKSLSFDEEDRWIRATDTAGWGGREQHSSIVYDKKMWVMGGYEEIGASSIRQNDVWYSTDGITWTEATDDANWSTRISHSSVVFDNKMWVIGGYDGSNTNDVWYSINGITWTQATASANWSARGGHSSVVFDNKMWVIGGSDGGVLNDVWYSTNGITWTQATASANWNARSTPTCIVYDNKLWLMGGEEWIAPSFVKQNDVWYSTDGATWTRVTDDANWVGRDRHASVVFDNKMWVLGGEGLGNSFNAWYSTDGITWAMVTTPTELNVSRSLFPSAVFNGKMWIFGGRTKLSDVWYYK